MDADDDVAALVGRLRAGQCVLWAGCNFDALFGGVSLREALARLLAGLGGSNDSEVVEARALLPGRPLLVAGFLRRRLGAGFADALRGACVGPAALTEPLALLGELPFRAVVTTTLSDLVPRAFAAGLARPGSPTPIHSPADLLGIARDAARTRCIVRALGDPDRPATVALTAADLRTALGEDQLAPVLRALFRGRSILFVGIDPVVDLDLLLAPVLRGVPAAGPDHFALLPGLSALERRELKATYRMRALDEAEPGRFVRTLFASVGAADPDAPEPDPVDAPTDSPLDDAIEWVLAAAQRTGRWQGALVELDRRAEGERGAGLARLRFEAGRIAARWLGDAGLAEERFHQALAADAEHVPAMTALVELHRKSGDSLRATRLLVEAAHRTTNRLDRTRFLVEAGEIYQGLGQPEVAIDLLRRALEADPEHVEAAGRLAELLWNAGRHAELVPVLEMLSRKPADRLTSQAYLLRLGRAARAAGQTETSARAFFAAAEADPGDAEVQREAGLLHYAEGNWAAARDALRVVLDAAPAAAPGGERADLYHRLGQCERGLGRLEEARALFAEALAIDPSHRPTLLSRMELEAEDPRGLIVHKRALLPTSSDDEKVRLLASIAETELGTFRDPVAALAALAEALTIRPDGRALLHRTLDIHAERQDWPRALATLERLVLVELDAGVRAKIRFTRAMIFLEAIGDAAAARLELEKAWDDDPLAAGVAAALEQRFIEDGDWKQLQRFYRRRIKTLPPEADGDTPKEHEERTRLWSALADLSLDRLGELDAGLSALEVAARLDRGPRRREQLAELYVAAGADYAGRAIVAHQRLLRDEPDRIPSYRALGELYGATGQPEKMAALSCALSLLGQGGPDDDELLLELGRRPLRAARRALDDELWNLHLIHPDEDRSIGQLFALLTPALAAANGQRYESVPLNRKDQVGADDGRGFAKAIRYVQRTLGVRMPFAIYARAEQPEPLAVVHCGDGKAAPVPCIIVGQPLLGERRGERELLYVLATRLCTLRPERCLRDLLTRPAQLGIVIEAAIALGGEAEGDPRTAAEASRIAQDLARGLAPAALSQVRALGRRLRGTSGLEAATAWLAACDLTAARAALLLIEDLETTATFVAAEEPSPGAALHPPLHRLKQLIQFSVSEDCFALRRHLGLLA